MSDTSPGYREYNEAPSVTGIGNFFSLPPLSIPDGIAQLLKLPSKLMAQHKFGTRRPAMLSFERQPFPAPCHVDQDVAHSRVWCALRHLTAFTACSLHSTAEIICPFPRTLHPANAATGITVWSASFAPGVHFETNSDLCATAYCAAGLRSTSRAIASTMSAGTPRRPVARGNFIVFVCPPRGGQVCCLQPGRLN